MRYMQATAQSLHAPRDYIRERAVAAANPAPARRAAHDAAAALSAAVSAGLLAMWLLLNQSAVAGPDPSRRRRWRWPAAGRWRRCDPPKARVRRPGVILRLCVSGPGRHRPLQHRRRPDHPRPGTADSGDPAS